MSLLQRAAVFVMAGLLAWPAPSQSPPSPLQAGDTLPSLAGQTFTGKHLALPAAAHGEQAVLIFSFSRAGGQEEQKWVRQLAKDHAHAVIYSAVFLESVPRLFRPLVLAGIRSGMPASLQDRMLLLYRNERLWKQRLNLVDENHAEVILLDPEGRIHWITSGPFTGALCAALEKQMHASR